MTSRDSVMISNEKQTLRVKMQAEIRRFVEKDAASKKIRQHLRDWEAWKSARVVFGFVALSGEPDWLGDDPPAEKLIAFPKTLETGMLRFHSESEFVVGSFGTHEPFGGKEAPAPDLVVVPGMAFDLTGARLGRGKGYYDRWIESHAEAKTLGICFKCQLVGNVPMEPHDVRVNAILTEDGFIWPAAGDSGHRSAAAESPPDAPPPRFPR